MKRNIKTTTIARLSALVIALANQCLVTFGRDLLCFMDNPTYQIVSLIAVVAIAAINAWYNNDISKIALLCGDVFDALSDGKITKEEIETLLVDTKSPEKE